MTRFNITLQGGVNMVMHALEHAWGGELFVPKIPSYKILDVAKAIGPNCKYPIVGIRPGEKVHEEMISTSDSFNTYDIDKYYVIIPQNPNWNVNDFIDSFSAVKVKKGFSYNSGDNDSWVTIDQIRNLITENIDSSIEFN
jgi:FlaA1/EpsC-like NDP-sugar epimerase